MEDAPIVEIRANVRKAFISDVYIIMFVAGVIGIAIFYIHSTIDLSGLLGALDDLKEVGINITPRGLLTGAVALVSLLIAIFLLIDYVTLGNTRYLLYADRLVYTKMSFIFHAKENVIPFSNIVKISFEKKSLVNSMDLTLELTGMEKNKLAIEFLDDAIEVAGKIHQLIREYHARYYAQYARKQKIEDIMGQL